MNSRRYIWCVLVDLAPIYSVLGSISVGINPLCDYHRYFILLYVTNKTIYVFFIRGGHRGLATIKAGDKVPLRGFQRAIGHNF
jgi:hypothetical protein